jgi:hypothetical protein
LLPASLLLHRFDRAYVYICMPVETIASCIEEEEEEEEGDGE